mgnify:CR=1 FL=1
MVKVAVCKTVCVGSIPTCASNSNTLVLNVVIAQQVEQRLDKPCVIGSNPIHSTICGVVLKLVKRLLIC